MSIVTRAKNNPYFQQHRMGRQKLKPKLDIAAVENGLDRYPYPVEVVEYARCERCEKHKPLRTVEWFEFDVGDGQQGKWVCHRCQGHILSSMLFCGLLKMYTTGKKYE